VALEESLQRAQDRVVALSATHSFALGSSCTVTRRSTKRTGTLPPGGGGDEFIRLLLDDVKRFVASRFNVDGKREAIFGKSLGGLAVLQIMVRHPTAFSSYIAASPYIQWNEREVLHHVGPFAERAKAGELNIRLLVTAGGTETEEMTSNASDFVKKLASLNLKGVTASYVLFPGEDHSSVSLASLGRAMTFGLPPPNLKSPANPAKK
jgi:uncharacterized protein